MRIKTASAMTAQVAFMVASLVERSCDAQLAGRWMSVESAPPEAQYALGGADNHTSVLAKGKAGGEDEEALVVRDECTLGT
jgi:hypothetical protein